MMAIEIKQEKFIPDEYAGKRIDQTLALLFPDYSRSRLRTWLESGQILVNHETWRPKTKVSGGELITINAQQEEPLPDAAEPIPLNIVFEDDAILVINKPIGLVVHPAAGNRKSTLLNALLYHDPELAHVPRAGIVHRIDKETSGLLVIAKTLKAHTSLVRQLKSHKIKREYEAIVYGILTGGGKIDAPIGRHPTQRTRMAVVEEGKSAITHYRIIEKFNAYTHIRLELETGRTHQIRVHMAYIHHPILGDPTYSGRLKLPKGASPELIDALRKFKHQALHARRLTFLHPVTEEEVSCEAELPVDFQALLSMLRTVSNQQK